MSLEIPDPSTIPAPAPKPDNDAFKAAGAIATQRVAAWADKHNLTVTPEQCEELAEALVDLTYAFVTGYNVAARDQP